MVERRKHKRYPMPRGIFAILRNDVDRLHDHAKMNIGEIAMVLYKSEPEIIGQVKDMSFGGVAFKTETDILPETGKAQLDLLMTEHGIYLHNIPYVTVPAGPVGKGRRPSGKNRRNAFHFLSLSTEQKGRLRDLLSHHVG